MTQLFLALCLAVLGAQLASAAPGFSRTSSVSLNGRSKEHGQPEKCPLGLNHCKCRARGVGLDITCEQINGYQLNVSALSALVLLSADY